jgi:DNA (cytosine-5)-methyltransferase 1
MFTGGGFMDIGFEQAGFDVVWTNEINPEFAAMFVAARQGMTLEGARKEPRTPNQTSVANLKSRTVLREAFGPTRPKLFGVIGGPPCPDFSVGGRNNGSAGENGRLTASFVRLLCKLKPAFFVMENVPGLFHTAKHRRFLNRQISLLRKSGNFLVDHKILNSLQFGAPQDRERLFLVGVQRSLAYESLDRSLPKDAIGWFPWPVDPRYANARQLQWPKTSPFGRTPKKPQGIPDELTPFAHFGPQNDPTELPNGMDVFHAHSDKFHIRAEGDVHNKSFKRLHRYRFSPTAWYGNQEVHLHPWLPRRLSVREALRLQTVPDDYVLPADGTLSAKFKLVCNGVPCVMARAVAEAVRVFVSSSRSARKALQHTRASRGRP